MGVSGHVIGVKLLYCLIVLHYVYNYFTLHALYTEWLGAWQTDLTSLLSH